MSNFPAKRIFGLDLIRALAIILVFIAHLDAPLSFLFRTPALQPLLSKVCGFYGVELFFVLSGYLMAPIFERVLASTESRWKEFRIYLLRRWMRTLPLYYIALVLHLSLPITAIGPYPVWPFFLFLQNLWWRMSGGGFFLLSWSLTIEEIFYVVFPVCALCLSLLRRLSSRQILVVVALILIFVCGVLRIFTFSPVIHWDDDVRRVALFRLDSLAFGVLVFCFRDVLYRLPRPVVILVPAAGLFLSTQILLNEGSYFDYFRKTLIYLLTSSSLCIVVSLSALIINGKGVFAKIVTTTSLFSYSFYLFHWPILQYTDRLVVSHREHPLLLILAGMSVLYMVGYLSFRFIEEPIMRRRPHHDQ